MVHAHEGQNEYTAAVMVVVIISPSNGVLAFAAKSNRKQDLGCLCKPVKNGIAYPQMHNRDTNGYTVHWCLWRGSPVRFGLRSGFGGHPEMGF